MALAALQRRTARLEKLFVVDSVAHYPRLTTDEMKALANRIADGQKCTAVETARVARQCPFTYRGEDGGLVVHAHKDGVYALRMSAEDMLL